MIGETVEIPLVFYILLQILAGIGLGFTFYFIEQKVGP